MKALTIRQPFAHAIAHMGKNIENRSRRPPLTLLGKRIAIHVSKSTESWHNFIAGEHMPAAGDRTPLNEWAATFYGVPMPNAGMIIATARIAEWINEGGLAACVAKFQSELLRPEIIAVAHWSNRHQARRHPRLKCADRPDSRRARILGIAGRCGSAT